MRARPARVRCSARNTATKCAWSRWVRAAATRFGWSVELCGGTHVKRTGDIGLISGVTEGAVASGVRRLEALTGRAARKHSNALAQRRERDSERTPARQCHRYAGARVAIAGRAQEARTRAWRSEEEACDGRRRAAKSGDDGVRAVGDVKLLARAVEGIDPKDLRSLADEGKKRDRLRRRRHRRQDRRRQSRHCGRRDVRSHQTFLCGRSRARRRGSARRQGRGRAPGHGAGRRVRTAPKPMPRSRRSRPQSEAADGGPHHHDRGARGALWPPA